MAFPPKEDPVRSLKDCWDSPNASALSTCSNADIFRRINAMLDNSLDFSGVCTTPVTKSKCDTLPDIQDSEEAVASRMLFPTSTQESSRGLPDTNDLCLGLQSLNLTGWDRPWSTQDSDTAAQTSPQSVQTYVMGRVWACSHKLLAGMSFPLDPFQSAFAAGIGWGIPGMLGTPLE
ncbi:hypothetical protein DV515_00006227 [Chloebia gouldiae]|uniref:Cytoplasmic polyadenylation element-binding protein 1 N-terminal domain-containing protein n=1 Tax=Chloebia gouldiae TaxID=44316 RepID=A0A3L8SLP6_CHLGU|nr:hypothetical protein DV515_00006227 [Chloebia gouldiae]